MRVFCGANAWVGVILLLRMCTSEFSGATFGAIVLCGAVLVYFLCACDEVDEFRLLSDGTVDKSRSSTVSSEAACLLSALRLRELVGKKNRSTDRLAITYLVSHIKHCTLRSCRAQTLYDQGKLSINTNRGEVVKALTSVINSRFKEALIRQKQSALIRILYVGFLLTHAKNYILAWEVNESVKTCKASLLERVHHYLYRYPRPYTSYRKRIKGLIDRQTAKLERSLEPLEMELRERSSDKICRLIVENGTAYGQFWDTLQDRSPLYMRFVTLGFAILKGNKCIKRIWRGLSSAKGRVPLKLLSVYLAYADQVLRDSAKSNAIKEYFDRPELLIQDNVVLQYVGSGNGVLGASADNKQLKYIKQANAAMCELSGYTREELKITRLETLLPRIFVSAHEEDFMRMCSLAEVGEEIPLVAKQTFLVHKSQYIVPVVVQVVAGPNYTNNYSFIARVRRDKVASRFEVVHILADEKNVVIAVTSSIFLPPSPKS